MGDPGEAMDLSVARGPGTQTSLGSAAGPGGAARGWRAPRWAASALEEAGGPAPGAGSERPAWSPLPVPASNNRYVCSRQNKKGKRRVGAERVRPVGPRGAPGAGGRPRGRPGPSRPAPPVAAGRRRAREDQPHLQGREERARGGLQRPEALLRKHFPRTDRSRQRSVVVLAGAPRDAAGACPAAGRPPRPRHLKARAALALRRARFLAERGDHVPALLFPLVYALILIF